MSRGARELSSKCSTRRSSSATIPAMSGLEDRCTQFHEAAMGTGKSKGPAKEIATLRKFLHKNQTQRFTDKAASRLFDTIQIYCTDKSKEGDNNQAASANNNVPTIEDREGLLEDALKMPFTVFTTKQKKTMLKWIEDIRGKGGGNGQGDSYSSSPLVKLTVIDVDSDLKCLSLMQEDTGDTYEYVSLPSGELGEQIQKAFESTDEALDVEATFQDKQITIRNLCVE